MPKQVVVYPEGVLVPEGMVLTSYGVSFQEVASSGMVKSLQAAEISMAHRARVLSVGGERVDCG